MTERYLSINGSDSSKSDDDEASSTAAPEPELTNREKLLRINSASFDSIQNGDIELEVPVVKVKKRKSRRTVELENHTEEQAPPVKKQPWYIKVDISTPIMFVALAFVIYFMWVKRDVWVTRLLTSNSRVRRSSLLKEDRTANDIGNSSSYSLPTPSLEDSSSDSSDDKDTNKNTNQKEEDDPEDNLVINLENNDDPSPPPTKQSSGQKLNVRSIRRNKMSFSRDRPKKKHRHLKNQFISDDVEDNDVDITEGKKSSELKKTGVLLPNQPLDKRHHRALVKNENLKTKISSNSGVRLPKYDHIIEQLRKLLEPQGQNRDFFTTITKTTGLSKDKVHRFIYKKDFRVLTLQTFIKLLDTFNLTLLIVPI